MSAPDRVPWLKLRMKIAVLPAVLAAVTVMLALVSYSLGHSWRYNLEDIVSEYETDVFVSPRYIVSESNGSRTIDCTSDRLGDYDSVKQKLDGLDFIAQYSVIVAYPLVYHSESGNHGMLEEIIGYDQALNDQVHALDSDGISTRLQANEIWYVEDNIFRDGDKPFPHLPRLKDGDPINICGSTLVARQVPEDLKQRIRSGEFLPCVLIVDGGLVLPMSRLRALKPAKEPVSFFHQQIQVGPDNWCPYPASGGVTLIKIALKPDFKTPDSIDEVVNRLKEIFEGAMVVTASRPLGELPLHLLAVLNMLSILSYLMWPGLALAVFVQTARRYREGRSALELNVAEPTGRQMRVVVWLESLLPAFIGAVAGFFLAFFVVGWGLGALYYYELIPPDLKFDMLFDERMLLPILYTVALSFALTFLAAFIPARAALRRGQG